jgi:hypothetical protein
MIVIRLASAADVPARAELRRASTFEQYPGHTEQYPGHTERCCEVEGYLEKGRRQ